MAVLGIYEGHNAGAALVSERSGEVVAVIEEERFSRIKNHDARPGAGSLPIRSIRWCLERAHETHEPVAAIAIGLMAPDLLQQRASDNFAEAVASGESQRMHRASVLGLDEASFFQLPHSSQTERVTRAIDAVRIAGLDPATSSSTTSATQLRSCWRPSTRLLS